MAKSEKSTGVNKSQTMNPMFKMMLKQFIPAIEEKLELADGFILEMQKAEPLQPGEDEIIFVLTTEDEIAYVATVAVSVGAIVRVCNKKPLKSFVAELLKKI